MQISVIGLGKMGFNLTEQLLDNGHQVKGYDINQSIYTRYKHDNLTYLHTLEELSQFDGKQYIFMLLPAGDITYSTLKQLSKILKEEDVIVDFSNSNYKVSIENSEWLKEFGIQYHDCGLSGGVKGARHGACMMLGGLEFVSKELLDVLESLCVPSGFQAYANIGSGHYLKMVHNGIEYGMMQSIAEGLELLKEQSHYDFNLGDVTANWEVGSIIESALLTNIHEELVRDPELVDFPNKVHPSGEAKWMLSEALDEEIAVPVISLSLMKRNASLKELSFSNQVLSAMRYNFGGHKNY